MDGLELHNTWETGCYCGGIEKVESMSLEEVFVHLGILSQDI